MARQLISNLTEDIRNGKETTVIFYEYDVNSYLAIADGGTPMTVPADKVDQIIRTVRSL